MKFIEKIHKFFNCKCEKCCLNGNCACEDKVNPPVQAEPQAPVSEPAQTQGGTTQA